MESCKCDTGISQYIVENIPSIIMVVVMSVGSAIVFKFRNKLKLLFIKDTKTNEMNKV